MDNVFATVARQRDSRYQGVTVTAPTPEAGTVGIGFTRKKDGENGAPFLVHRLSRSEEAIALGAVGAALGTVIPVASIVAALTQSGQIEELRAAIPAPPEAKPAAEAKPKSK
jgi:hypothetical protein